MLRAPTQVSWKRSVCAMANFHCEVAAHHPLPKTPCAAIGRCASRGCLASLGGPIERLGHLRFVPNPLPRPSRCGGFASVARPQAKVKGLACQERAEQRGCTRR